MVGCLINPPIARLTLSPVEKKKSAGNVSYRTLNATSAARIAKAGAGGKRLIDGREKVLIGGIVPTRPSEQEEVDSYLILGIKLNPPQLQQTILFLYSRFGLL